MTAGVLQTRGFGKTLRKIALATRFEPCGRRLFATLISDVACDMLDVT